MSRGWRVTSAATLRLPSTSSASNERKSWAIGVGGWRFWTFNLADVGVTCGAILLALLLLRRRDVPAQAEPADA